MGGEEEGVGFGKGGGESKGEGNDNRNCTFNKGNYVYCACCNHLLLYCEICEINLNTPCNSSYCFAMHLNPHEQGKL